MSFDASRFTFDAWKDYAGVAMAQGRVQTDADWNEWLTGISRRLQAGTLDTVGRAVYPLTTPNAFQIAATSSGSTNKISIGVGRMYVDGLLAENHGDPSTAVWDPALAELSNAAQPAASPPKPLDASNSIDFTAQPYAPGASVPSGAGSYLAYLDVWRRPITFIEDPSLIDPAIGIDTTGRVQTAWQVRLMAAPAMGVQGSVTSGAFITGEAVKQTGSGATSSVIGAVAATGPMYLGAVTGTADGTGDWVGQTSGAVFKPTAAPAATSWSCATPDSAIPWPTSGGRLSNGTVSSGPSGPCCLTTGSGFTGPENQLYRVEIHTPAGGAGATFKWSRENASVQTNVTDVTGGSNTLGAPASVLTVQSLGRDQVLGFNPGDWIEISDQTHDDNCQPGELYQIDSVQPATSTITLTGLLSASFSAATLATNSYTRICRWDQKGTVFKADNTAYVDLDATSGGVVNGSLGIPVPTDGSALILEGGITVTFSLAPAGGYQPLDFWCFSARAATGTIDILTDAPPVGQHHHYTKLSIVTFGASPGATDCRTPWPPGTAGDGCDCCCTLTVGVDGAGMYSSINQAVQALPADGGEVCILPGQYYEHVLLQGLRNTTVRGCGVHTVVSSPSLNPAGAPAADGLEAVFTIVGCVGLELSHLAIEADEDDVGVLLDRAVKAPPSTGGPSESQPVEVEVEVHHILPPDTRIELKDLAISASRRPGIAALLAVQLHVLQNTVLMDDVQTLFPAVYLRGKDIVFERNVVRVVPQLHLLADDEAANPEAFHMRIGAPGGVQVGGRSRNVVILENEISGGSRNGITVGDIITLDPNGRDTGGFNGVQVGEEDPCGGGSGRVPGGGGGGGGRRFGAGGLIENLIIDRNLITDHGLCGIGPVGFFNLYEAFEVVSLVNVTITENIITRVLRRILEAIDAQQSAMGYGAISLPDVENLTIRDNTIRDFGATPGSEVCGIYVLHGEVIEISRNKITETRDDTERSEAQASYGGQRAGIFIELVTPLAANVAQGSSWATAFKLAPEEFNAYRAPFYNPGLPALRIQENLVRVAIGLALSARGTGPFSIVDNHFSTGGAVPLSEEQLRESAANPWAVSSLQTLNGALTVAILNLGTPLEAISLVQGFASALGEVETLSDARAFVVGGMRQTRAGANGTVLFTNNICQFESRGSGARGICSVGIATLDHVLCANNQLWFDAPERTAETDLLLLGATVQATSNRLQEAAQQPVLYSGMTRGLANITSQNLSTYCVKVMGFPAWTVRRPNVELDMRLCRDRQQEGLQEIDPVNA